jgi:hypothetical protein
LLFFRLGYYPLWGDEADTALYFTGIWRLGSWEATGPAHRGRSSSYDKKFDPLRNLCPASDNEIL